MRALNPQWLELHRHKLLEMFMLNLTARWCHNVLLAAMGLLTIAFVFSAM
jgi:hypothetical protein